MLGTRVQNVSLLQSGCIFTRHLIPPDTWPLDETSGESPRDLRFNETKREGPPSPHTLEVLIIERSDNQIIFN